ncbi:hypothetical protein [Nocardioides daphniae]|uniref:Uncharacterized protein n=1 Tax=Nocardioides daphniae TaxID=402297 RepID=A0ABQ1QKF8_9ACTN|nr:hypothetical protein [Nocardioides daphniae]GGD31067.1 hypothetical protein GCM10007231_33250 [Nocardioides daphniae]
MRSKSRRPDPGQAPLWEGPADEPARPARARRAGSVELRETVVEGDEFLSRGWASGTVLHYEPSRRADRGALAVVRLGERLVAGEFGLERGRPVLRTDLGALWLGPHTHVVGVVRIAEPPLPGIPGS